MIISLFCILLSCSKSDCPTCDAPTQKQISKDIQNAIAGKTILYMNVGNNIWGQTYQNPVITFTQDCLVINNSAYVNFDTIVKFEITPASGNGSILNITVLNK